LAVVGGVLVLFLVEILLITLTQSLSTLPPPNKSGRVLRSRSNAAMQTKGNIVDPMIPMAILLDVASPPLAFNLIAICVLALAAAMVTNAPDATTNANAAATTGKPTKVFKVPISSIPPLLSPPSQAAGSSVVSRATVVQISALVAMSGMHNTITSG
jgi:hypothetical protein